MSNERDELARIIKTPERFDGGPASCGPNSVFAARTADAILAAGYRKPHIIPDAHLVQDGDGNWGKEYPENTIIRVPDGGLWACIEWDALEWEHIGHGSSRLEGPATVLWEPQP